MWAGALADKDHLCGRTAFPPHRRSAAQPRGPQSHAAACESYRARVSVHN